MKESKSNIELVLKCLLAAILVLVGHLFLMMLQYGHLNKYEQI